METEIAEGEDQMQAKENPNRPEFYANQNDKQQLYDGMLVQDHDNDSDDIVPEYSEDVNLQTKAETN
jgi:hypothetical protein